jgi:DNA-binding MarR family transcriptional regulator
MKTATAIQLRVLEAFNSHVTHREISPTVRELADDLERTSYAVECNVRRLIAKGYLRKVGGAAMARNLRLVDATSGTFRPEVR